MLPENLSLVLILLAGVVFLAAAEQTVTGFGFALIVMPAFSLALGLRVAAPLGALVAITLYLINLVRQREAVNVRELAVLALGAVMGVPFGVWTLANVSESILKTSVGLILIGYALSTRVRPLAQPIQSPGWAMLAGLVSGSFTGAYNIPGPPLVVYGSLRGWDKREFRAGLQALFALSSALTIASHLLAQNITPTILAMYAWIAPAVLGGIGVGVWLDRWVDKERFRALVMVMIVVLGISLIQVW